MTGQREKLVVLSGAGISAESGLSTFRDSGGLWQHYSVYEVATPEAFASNPERVLKFYNERRREVRQAQPNAAHQAIAKAERSFDVQVITQNIDDLHERAGASNIWHVHGLITQARSQVTGELINLAGADINPGDTCPYSEQLRPHVVWFGEEIFHLPEAITAVEQADVVIVVGTSLTVFPFAGLVDYIQPQAEGYLVTQDTDQVPPGFQYLQGPAATELPQLLQRLMARPGA